MFEYQRMLIRLMTEISQDRLAVVCLKVKRTNQPDLISDCCTRNAKLALAGRPAPVPKRIDCFIGIIFLINNLFRCVHAFRQAELAISGLVLAQNGLTG